MSTLADQATAHMQEMIRRFTAAGEGLRAAKAGTQDPVALEALTNLQAEMIGLGADLGSLKAMVGAVRMTGGLGRADKSDPAQRVPTRDGKMAAAHDDSLALEDGA